MGVIALALAVHAGDQDVQSIPNWVKISAGLTIAAGTYFGGWRIIRTLGQRIYGMQPEHGFASQLAAGTTLWLGTKHGFPISTTHVVSGSVLGAGSTRRLSAVKWGVAGNIVFAWILTLPAAALVAALLYFPVSWIF
jgi:PiT family inorganic phosphate transporter